MNNNSPLKSIRQPEFFNRLWLYTIAIVLIFSVTFISYGGTFFNFLIMDDFGFIVRLKDTVDHPALLLQPFFHSYMGEPNYYRPLIILVWYAECVLWGANGLCFRIASIIFMLLGGLVLSLITLDLGKLNNTPQGKSKFIWALLSASLFALSPLHVPTVNWFAAQHTPLVTLFYLLSLWLYMRWRDNSKLSRLMLSLCVFILSMLTEEMSVTLPAILVAYELLFIKKLHKYNWKTALTETFLITAPYWFFLAIYFCIRMIVLGTLICKVSIWARTGSVNFVKGWMHGIHQILVPIDFYTIPQASLLAIFWQILIVAAISLCLYTCIRSRTPSANRKILAFLIFWFLLSLAPADNIFATSVPNLLNFRVAFLATAPLCIFLAFGIANFCFDYKCAPLVRVCGTSTLLLSSLILYCNNWGLRDIGLRTNQIRQNLQQYCEFSFDQSPVKILGLPLVNSLYVSMIAKRPFLDHDIFDCSSLNANNQLYPFGYLKRLIGTNEGKVRFLYWDEIRKQLRPTTPYWSTPPVMSFPVAGYEKTWRMAELRAAIHPKINLPDQLVWENNGIPHVTSKKCSSLEINFSDLPCWPVDFICFKIEDITKTASKLEQYELQFTNDINLTYPSKQYCQENTQSRITTVPCKTEHTLIFPLGNNPYWALGNKCHALKLVLPANVDFKLKEITVPNTASIIPLIKGRPFIRLSQRSQQTSIYYDASGLKDCTKVTLEIIGPFDSNEPDIGFEILYSQQPERHPAFNISANAVSGILKLNRTMFPEVGGYKARVRALDKSGKQVGLAGDHFLISVEK